MSLLEGWELQVNIVCQNMYRGSKANAIDDFGCAETAFQHLDGVVAQLELVT